MVQFLSLVVLLLVVVVLLAVILSPVHIRVHYVLQEGRGRFRVDLRAFWGGIRKTWVWTGSDGSPLPLHALADADEWRGFSLRAGRRMFRLWKRHSGLRRMIRTWLRGVKVRKWKTHLRFGTGDAMTTGVLAGVFWSFFYAIAAVLGNRVRLCDPEATLTPEFRKRILEIEVEGIAQFRVGQAIGAGVAMAIALWKEGLMWRNTRLKV
ncbi:MAG: DUF2953 domain-containing protein [Alicyclobacillaceae bacterium]|nr:DUF2953 domain-containing protein [Alicyclobacillaceae bacterium]